MNDPKSEDDPPVTLRARSRFRIRTLMILVAISAVILLGVVELVKFDRDLQAFYGPGGTLEREHKARAAGVLP